MAARSQVSVESGLASGKYLPGWETAELPPPPAFGWSGWLSLLGPGLLLAGASVGAGEWLFGPAVTAQYGAVLLWLATLSIVGQVFCNLQMMRYTLYCGEPIVVGFFRTWPGPRFWTVVYILLDVSMIWPMNAANGAVPLAAMFLGHLPGDASISVAGFASTERVLVQFLGYAIFVAAFLPLVFGGAIYRMLEKLMAAKIIFVLGFLIVVSGLMVSVRNAGEVCAGFVQFGMVPLRANTVVAGRHFVTTARLGKYSVRGTVENGRPIIVGFTVLTPTGKTDYQAEEDVPADLRPIRLDLAASVAALATPNGFLVRTVMLGTLVELRGRIVPSGAWELDEAWIDESKYRTLDAMNAKFATRCQQLLANQGQENVHIVNFVWEHEQFPPLDWAMLAAFAAIAGAGGMTNTLFSNYARDKGWGMGSRVGALPSALGGTTVTLSHVGKVFSLDEKSLAAWRGWIRWIFRDQIVVWMVCSFVGMALPCMLSLEFIRHAPVAGQRVPAMLADGMAHRYPELGGMWWFLALFVGFIVIAPGQIIAGDQIARRWTDILWSVNRWTDRWEGNQVKYLYYGILSAYGVWGFLALSLFNPLQIAQITGVLGNVALAVTALHSLHVNRTLLPPELRPGWIAQFGTLLCGIFFLTISGIVLWNI